MSIYMLFQSIIILFVFALFYQLLFRWKKEFLSNRIYLILAVVMAGILPFIKLKVFPYKVLISNKRTSEMVTFPVVESQDVDWLLIGYLVGFGFSFMYMLFRLFKIVKLIKNSSFERKEDALIAKNHITTFSFFKFVFLKKNEEQLVLHHEIVHVRRKHSYDIIFFEFAKVLLWFNPFVLLIYYFARENHEFEADFEAMRIEKIDEITMAEFILNYIENKITGRLLITNNFFSLTKNRLIMLSKNKKANKYIILLIVPIFLVIFSAFSFKSYPVYETPDGLIVQDTLIPGYISKTDTTVTFDPNTKEEILEIVKNTVSMDEYIKGLNFSGKMVEIIDTAVSFDPKTNVESLEVHKIKIPYELRFQFDNFSVEQQGAIIKEYGSMTIMKLKE